MSPEKHFRCFLCGREIQAGEHLFIVTRDDRRVHFCAECDAAHLDECGEVKRENDETK